MYKLSIEVDTLAELSELTRKLNSDSAASVELTTVKKKAPARKKAPAKKAPVAEAPTVEADTNAVITPEQAQTVDAPVAQEVNGFANVFQTPTANAAAPVAQTKEELLAEVQGMFAAAAGLTQEQQSEVIQGTYTFLGWDVSKKLSECTAEELNRAIPKFKGSLHAKGVMV